MKKALAVFLAAALTAVSFAGCGSSTTASSAAPASQAASSKAAESAAATGTLKTGLAVITSIAKSTDVKDGKGLAEADSTVVAVAVDKDGKIVKCLIDAVQSKVNFSDAGKITTPLDTVVKSKQELGAEYGLGKASGIKKEWNEQADAFASYVVGKTADEVKGIAVDAEGKATDKELTASVTIHVGDFIAGVEKAVANAADNGAKADDKLGLGIQTSISGSKDAGDKDGLAQAYSYYTVTTTGADGKITSCIIDASQTNVNFSKAGKITSDLKAEQKTKNELGDAYGMKKASKIGKEWNEEAASFAKYVVGKTLDEVKGIAVDSEGKATDKELTASVTVHVGDFIKIIDEAVSSAK
ncbi:hypothetical protein [Caproiciproducens faecalis]|uniref:Uncharacterized protein n=1 Tax=Caproiciproducens faecalis TaxID=2820301 RepID=A0ABS7DSN3_9FIRM|nr:hypothetical protein [Caproiciproducens faecalis]MBW7573830.1 hypothetical protein [Caproiciproducens faecalis]